MSTPDPLSEHLPELHRYLTRATRGLWGKRRTEVKAELEEHVLERADHLMVFGVPPREALSRAISELGPPGALGAGMTQVYLMPKLLQFSAFSALTAAVVSLSLSLSGQGNAQVAVISFPRPPVCAVSSKGMNSNARIEIVSQQGNQYCYRFRQDTTQKYLDLGSLEQTLKSQGVVVSREGQHTLLSFPGAAGKARLKPNMVRGKDRFIGLEQLPFSLSGTGLPVTLTGWLNPTVQVGQMTFKLGTPGSTVPGALIYERVMLDIGFDLNLTGQGAALSGRGRPTSSAAYFTHSVQVDFPEGTVVGIFSRDERGLVLVDEAPVGRDGQVQLFSPRKELRYVTDPKQLSPYLSGGQGQALLVRLTGVIADAGATPDDRYRVIQPRQVSTSGSR